jgi:hypothetical protein
MALAPMRTLASLFLAISAALASAAGCGGVALTSQNGDAGPLATCGDHCSASQTAASCSDTCNKIARAGCTSAGGTDCAKGCASVTSMAPACATLANDYLRCVESVQPTCTDSGMVQFAGCDSQQQALSDCAADSGSSVPTPTPTTTNPGGTVPSSVCPNIPRPGASGVGPCSGGGGGGPNGTVSCQFSCQDSAGNTWQASCAGSSCTCSYNGGLGCSCTMTGAPGTCVSCCPGTG